MIYETHKLYPQREDVTLTTYIVQHSKEFLGNRKRPAVLICPGGGYMVCSETEGEPVAVTFNRMGYHAFVLHYSVYSDPDPDFQPPDPDEERPVSPFEGMPPVIPPKERSVFPNPMLDIQAAMEFIIAHAEEWGVDPDQIALCGFSAGAHNAGIYSAYCVRRQMPKPAATILGYPLGDIRDNFYPGMSDMVTLQNKNFCVAMLGTAEPTEEQMDTVSIVKQIDENTPPMFLWNTSQDEMVLPVNSLHIAEALSRNHVPYELHTFERGPHGLSTADEISAIGETQLIPEVAAWTELVRRWLANRLTMDFPARMPF